MPPDGRDLEPAVAGGECPRCGAAYAPLQEYCLECGVRLPREPAASAALAAAAGRPSPWYAGDWVWPVLVTLVVAVLTAVAAVAIAAARDDNGPTLVVATTSQPDQILTGTTPTTPATTTAPGTVTLPEEQPPPPPATKPPPPPPRRAPRVVSWPAGRNGFTVVLASVPQDARPAATAKAKDALDAGLSQVGVLESSRYSSLHPGYLVVFSGVYRSHAEAQTASERARDRGYSDAYAAEVAK
jgi:hypothetical protein